MKILGMTLDGIQTYKQSTFIPFSTSKTIIKGGNDKGKSVIKKALGVFANIYTSDDIGSLINYERDDATITLFLSNRTVMVAFLTEKSIVYRLYTWQLDICLKEWLEYNQEISRYLGWVTVPGEELCINLAESDVNVLVNTSKTTNTQIIKSISTIPEIDLKLENLNNALEEAKETNKWATAEMRVQETYCTFNERRYEAIKATRQHLVMCRKRMNSTLKVAKILYDMVDLYMKLIEQKKNESEKSIYLCKMANVLTKQIQTKGYMTKVKSKIKYISSIRTSIDILSELKNKYKETHIISNNKSKAYSIEHNLKLLKVSLNMINLKYNMELKQKHLKINDVSRTKIVLNQLYLQKIMSNYHDKVLKLKQKSQLINMLHDLNSIIIYQINNKKEMDKFEVCPLCHQPLGGSEHEHK